MTYMGICEQITSWAAAFLRDKTQVVTLQGASSNPCPVTSGVPQGSVVWSALFLLYINDLPYKVKSKVWLFADDTIIYATSDTSDQLMEDLRGLEQWEKDWCMEFQSAKCEYIRFSRKRVKSQLPSYMLHQELIPQVKAIRYLGVHIQDNLKWHTHIDMITSRSSTTLGFVKRTIPPTSSQLRIRVYKQLVRPVLEYACYSWNPLPKTLSTQVEAI